MNSKPWTAVILSNDGFNKICVVDEHAPLSKKEAKEVIQEKYQDYFVITLIPGFHAKYSYTFRPEQKPVQLGNSTIDPFEMSDL